MRILRSIAVLVIGSMSALSAQSPVEIPLEISPETVSAGQVFTISIKFPEEGIAEPSLRLPDLPTRISLIAGPDTTRGPGVDASGRRGSFVSVRYTFRAQQAGWVVFAPISVQYGTRMYRTQTAIAGVMNSPTSRSIPPDLVWKIHAPTVREGQAVLVTLDMRFATTIIFPEKINLTMPAALKAEEVPELGQIENERIAGRDFSRVPLSAWIVTLSGINGIVLPPIRLNFQDTTISAAAKTLVPLPLPPELSGISNAVGTYQFNAFVSKNQVRQNEEALLTIRLEGEGNLNVAHLPTPFLSNLRVLGSSENTKFVPSQGGYRGFRETVYRLSGESIAPAQVSVPTFQWFGMDGLVHAIPPQVLNLSIVSADHVTESSAGVPFRLLSVDEIEALRPWFLHGRIEGYVLLVPGFVLCFVALRRRLFPGRAALTLAVGLCLVSSLLIVVSDARAESEVGWRAAAQEGVEAYQRQDFQEAWRQFEIATSRDSASPGILHNLALASHRKNANAQALFYSQSALRLAPDNVLFRTTMREFEMRLGLAHQIIVVAVPNVDTLFIVFVSVWTVIGFMFLFRFFKKKVVGLVLGCGLVFVAAGALWGTAFSTIQTKSSVGIVAEAGTVLRKIPDRSVAVWLAIPAGTSVYILAHTDNFSLVQTAYGVQGWLETGVLYRGQL